MKKREELKSEFFGNFYGLHQAPRAWYTKIGTYLKQ